MSSSYQAKSAADFERYDDQAAVVKKKRPAEGSPAEEKGESPSFEAKEDANKVDPVPKKDGQDNHPLKDGSPNSPKKFYGKGK